MLAPTRCRVTSPGGRFPVATSEDAWGRELGWILGLGPRHCVVVHSGRRIREIHAMGIPINAHGGVLGGCSGWYNSDQPAGSSQAEVNRAASGVHEDGGERAPNISAPRRRRARRR